MTTADNFSCGIIQQLIVNRIVMKQLQSKQEVKTRDLFNKIKNQWMDLVTVTSSSQFMVNSVNLEKALSSLSPSYQKQNHNETQLLLIKNDCNMDLLKNAIIAHAFSFQNLDIDTIRIDIISNKKLKGNWLYIMIRRLLQKDIKPFVFLNKREIGYGIEYVMKNKTIHFVGQLTYDLKDDTIVVHVKNNRGRILREIWLTGENQGIHEHSLLEDVSEAL